MTPTKLHVISLALVVLAACKDRSSPPDPLPEPPGGVSGVAPDARTVSQAEGGGAKAARKVYWNQVAGQFYPADPVDLANAVAGYMKEAAAPPVDLESRDLLGLVSPHAGYPYSGPVAGSAYRMLDGRNPATVVIIAFAHKGGVGKRSAVLPYEAYRTPLGEVPIDTDMIRDLLERGKGVIEASEAPFAGEHSLEVQLPFLQKAVPDARIVPIMVGHLGGRLDAGLADLLHEVIGDRSDVVVIASTDLSHYEPYETAVVKDGKTLDLVAALDWGALEADGIQAGRMCGFYPVGVLMRIAALFGEGKAGGTRIAYRNSGDTAGSRDGGVVGYGVVAFTLPAGTRSPGSRKPGSPAAAGVDAGSGQGAPGQGAAVTGAASGLGPEDLAALQRIALEAAVGVATGKTVQPEKPSSKALGQPAGALVILKAGETVRGMGGNLDSSRPLVDAAVEAARAAAAGDARFPAIRAEEAGSLEAVVFVVASTWPLADPSTFDPAIHGLFVEAGGIQAFVGPGETGGGNAGEDALDQACRRVGLAPGCWKGSKQGVAPTFTAFAGGKM